MVEIGQKKKNQPQPVTDLFVQLPNPSIREKSNKAIEMFVNIN